jgi:hypothetical protein
VLELAKESEEGMIVLTNGETHFTWMAVIARGLRVRYPQGGG